MMMSVRCV